MSDTNVETVVERITREANELSEILDGFFDSALGQVIFAGAWASEPELHEPISHMVHTLCEVREVFQPKFDKTVWDGNANGTIPPRFESVRKQREDTERESAPKSVAEQIAAARAKRRK